MLRDVAVTRIQDGLGFAVRQADKIVLRLQEAQRELEQGKTLPKFLLVQNATLTLPVHTSVVNWPTDFLRLDDDDTFYYTNSNGQHVYVAVSRFFQESLQENFTGEYGFPTIVVLRNGLFQFIPSADVQYVFTYSYYKRATLLTTNVTNAWLDNAPEWLIGEAGWRIAMDNRDKDAVTLFDTMRKAARAACLADLIASEESTGPLVMGSSL